MVLSDVVAKEASLVGGGDEAQSLVELRCERAVVAVDVIEQSEFHVVSRSSVAAHWSRAGRVRFDPAQR